MAGGPDAPHLIHIHGCTLRVELAEVLPIIPNAASQLHNTLPSQSQPCFPSRSLSPNLNLHQIFTRMGGQHSACIRSPAAGCAHSKQLHMAAKHGLHLEIG